MKINKDNKLYELIFYIIASVFIIITFLGVIRILQFSDNVQYIFQAIFSISIGIGTIRKVKVGGLLFIIAGILFIVSAI